MNKRIAVRTLLIYGLRSSWQGGVIGGVVGGSTYLLAGLLFGFLDLLISYGPFFIPSLEEATPVGILYGYCGFFLIGAIGGAGLGLLGGTIIGPTAACFLYLLDRHRDWIEAGAVIGGIAGAALPLIFTSGDALSLIKGVDTDILGLLLPHIAGTLGGALGGAIAGQSFQGLLERHPHHGGAQT